MLGGMAPAIVALLASASPIAAVDYDVCGTAKRITCVVDGDTFWVRGEKVRIINIDAPEIQHAKCDAERRLGMVTRQRLGELLSGGRLWLGRDGTDREGRTLALVRVNGNDLGEVLIAEGLARPWEGSRKEWC